MRKFTETPRTLRMSLIDFAKVLKQAVTEIWVMGRDAGKLKVVAFQQQRRRPYTAIDGPESELTLKALLYVTFSSFVNKVFWVRCDTNCIDS